MMTKKVILLKYLLKMNTEEFLAVKWIMLFKIVLTAKATDPNPTDRKSLKVTWEVPDIIGLSQQPSKDGLNLTLRLGQDFFKEKSIEIKATVVDQHGANHITWHTIALKKQVRPEISTVLKNEISRLPADDPVRKKMEALAKLGK